MRFGLSILILVAFTGPAPSEPRNTKPMTQGLLSLAPFAHSAFPYAGDIPDQGRPFLDASDNGRRGHTSPRGGVLWEDQAYSDTRSLLFVPPRFNPRQPAALVLFFHGNEATLDRDVRDRQGVPRQLAASHLNAVLVAPQMAVDALDSSAGHFYQPGFLDAYLDEAAEKIETLSKGRLHRGDLANLPIVIVAYSGGYLPAAFSLTHARTSRRILGVVLLDALFGEVPKFESWIVAARGEAFFVSASSKASAEDNDALQTQLDTEGLRTETGLPTRLSPGTLAFIKAPAAVHNDFVTLAWTKDPLAALLARIVP